MEMPNMPNLRLALRSLFRAPYVTIFAIISIALGIGANTAIFSIFERIWLRSLPVQEPDRLVNLSSPGKRIGPQSTNMAGGGDEIFSYPMFRDLEKSQTVFTGIAAHRQFSANLAVRGATMDGRGLLVSGSYFPLLGVRPAVGRLLGPQDDRVIGESPVVVLSYDYWKNRFGRDATVVNQTMIVNGQAMTIVGITQDGFDGTTFGLRPQVFLPITMRGFMELSYKKIKGKASLRGLDNRSDYWVYLFARLKPGIGIEQAQAALNSQYQAILNNVEAPLLKGMSEQTTKQFKAKPLILKPGDRGQSQSHRKETRDFLALLLGLTAIVLIIACANVANLLIARGAARSGEMAIRLSLGASRLRIVAQLLTESFLLALIAGGVGILVAQWTLDIILSILSAEIVQNIQFTLNGSVLIFATALTLFTGLLFGLFPALHSIRPAPVSLLKGQAGQPAGSKSAARFRLVLATAQIALSLILLVAAGHFTKSLLNVSNIDLGMKLDHVVSFGVSPFRNGYSEQQSLQFFERLEEELAVLPGASSVTNSLIRLVSSQTTGDSVLVEGYKSGPDIDTSARFNNIGPAYFRTLGIPLTSGREFTRLDSSGRLKVAIVNEMFVNKFNLGPNAVGKHIGNTGGTLDTEIVGVVKNATFNEVTTPPEPMFFRPYRQGDQIEHLTFYVRSSREPDQLFQSIRQLMARLDPNLPVENLCAMTQQVRDNTSDHWLISFLSTGFACLATLLAAVGLYGVLAYTVAQRTREIGLRMALGASQKQVRAMVLRQVGIMAFIGCAVGLVLGIGFGRIVESMLFQLQGSDPAVLCGAVVILALVALIAGYMPAYRASKIDPMQALRYE
jgi:predicted permease